MYIYLPSAELNMISQVGKSTGETTNA